jgi:hypothetical protein
VSARKNESIACYPFGIRGIITQYFLKEKVSNRRKSHGGTWVAIANFLNGIHRQRPRVSHCIVIQRAPRTVEKALVCHVS